jgi:hypothetical protein
MIAEVPYEAFAYGCIAIGLLLGAGAAIASPGEGRVYVFFSGLALVLMCGAILGAMLY